MNIANQGFPATRADLNNALQALASNNSGTSAPSTTFANQWWYDTANNKLYIRNEANNAWIQVAVLDQTNAEWQITTGVIQAKDSDGLALKTDDGTTRLFIKDSDGSIGIGTSSPASALHLESDTPVITLRDDSAYSVGTGPYVQFQGLDSGGTNRNFGQIYGLSNGSNSGELAFHTRNSGTSAERVRILSGGGLTFNGDTAAANALDDYETGTFTATFSGATVSPANTLGVYTKIGGRVFWSYYTQTATISSASGALIMGGLPYTIKNVNGNYAGVIVGMNTFFGSGTDGINGYHQINQDYIYFINPGTTASPTAVNGSGKYLMAGGHYEVA